MAFTDDDLQRLKELMPYTFNVDKLIVVALIARLEAAEAVSAQCADTLSNVAQLMDGWHSDVAWTSWDESVRKAVSEIQVKSDAWRKSKGEK